MCFNCSLGRWGVGEWVRGTCSFLTLSLGFQYHYTEIIINILGRRAAQPAAAPAAGTTGGRLRLLSTAFNRLSCWDGWDRKTTLVSLFHCDTLNDALFRNTWYFHCTFTESTSTARCNPRCTANRSNARGTSEKIKNKNTDKGTDGLSSAQHASHWHWQTLPAGCPAGWLPGWLPGRRRQRQQAVGSREGRGEGAGARRRQGRSAAVAAAQSGRAAQPLPLAACSTSSRRPRFYEWGPCLAGGSAAAAAEAADVAQWSAGGWPDRTPERRGGHDENAWMKQDCRPKQFRKEVRGRGGSLRRRGAGRTGLTVLCLPACRPALPSSLQTYETRYRILCILSASFIGSIQQLTCSNKYPSSRIKIVPAPTYLISRHHWWRFLQNSHSRSFIFLRDAVNRRKQRRLCVFCAKTAVFTSVWDAKSLLPSEPRRRGHDGFIYSYLCNTRQKWLPPKILFHSLRLFQFYLSVVDEGGGAWKLYPPLSFQ